MKSDCHSVSTIWDLPFETVKLLADREFADNAAAQADLAQVSPLFAFNARCQFRIILVILERTWTILDEYEF
jgi:hypothetical protein